MTARTDHIATITSVLAAEAELCADCIAEKTGIPPLDMPSVMARIAKTVRVEAADARCAACLMIRPVYRLA